MHSKGKRILAGLLVICMSFSVCSCKKKKKEEQRLVLETDPYYQAKVTELKFEPEKGKNYQYFRMNDPKIIGNSVVSPYEILNEYPKELKDILQSIYSNIDYIEYDLVRVMNMVQQSYDRGLLIYDFDGQELSRIELPFNSEVVTIAEGRNGEILCLVEHVDFNTLKRTREILIYSMEGIQTGSVKLPEDMDVWIQTFMVTSEGSYIFSGYGFIEIISDKGERIGTIEDEGIDGIIVEAGGDYYSMMYTYPEGEGTGEAGYEKLDIKEVKLTGENRKIASLTTDVVPGGDGKTYTLDGNGIRRVDLASGQVEDFLNWNDSDVNYTSYASDSIRVISEDNVAFLRTDYETDKITGDWVTRTKIVSLKKADKNPHVGKKYIDMGTIGNPPEDLLDYVVNYNTTEGNTARIRVVDYSSEVSQDIPYMKQQTMLAAKVYEDMTAGKGPDILVNFSCFSQFNSGEVLVDLNPYVDGENGLKREEYFDNVLSAFENRDKLFQIPVCFDIRGLLGNEKMVGKRPGWTYSEFNQIADTFPSDVEVFPEMEYNDLLEKLLSDAMLSFVDYTKKEVYFDGDEFRQLLSIVKEYGGLSSEESDPSNSVPGSALTPVGKMNSSKLALLPMEVYNLYQYAENRSILSGNTIYVGVPSPDGTGVSAQPVLTLAISSFSTSKEESWAFIRRLFDEDSQYTYTSSLGSIPLHRKAFDRINDDSLADNRMLVEQFETDSNNNGNPMPDSLVRITDSDATGFKALVENASTIVTSDPEIFSIIEEEAAFYFSDAKSVDEVCRIIQQRTSEAVSKR
ncbi:MAG: extracellular solute-binding protein [Clostridiales bacterium]|nr:extracellular solute-binding protein [Clostridiales bacterium]